MIDNWRGLSAGRALDRVVAERLGWTDVREIKNGAGFPELVGRLPNERFVVGVPSYSDSANIALMLPLAPGLCWHIMTADFAPDAEAKHFQASINSFGPYINEFNGRIWKMLKATNADTAAEAICKVWLSWKESSGS